MDAAENDERTTVHAGGEQQMAAVGPIDRAGGLSGPSDSAEAQQDMAIDPEGPTIPRHTSGSERRDVAPEPSPRATASRQQPVLGRRVRGTVAALVAVGILGFVVGQ